MNLNEKQILMVMSLAYHNFTLIRDLTGELLENSEMKLNEFYQKWSIQHFKEDVKLLPMNPGTVLMISYVNFLAAKQLWFDLFEETPISELDEKWGLTDAEIESDESSDPSLRYVIRRMRNGLAHYRIEIISKKEIMDLENTNYKEIMDNSYFVIRDIDEKTGKNFMIKINFSNLSKLNSEIYTTISNHFFTT